MARKNSTANVSEKSNSDTSEESRDLKSATGSTDGEQGDGAAPEPKPKFGTLYKAAMRVQEEMREHERAAKECKDSLSGALSTIVSHHGSGPWNIEGKTVSITERKGSFYFRGLKDAPEVSVDD